jgi:membrane protease YdiL (CAAX protease family)
VRSLVVDNLGKYVKIYISSVLTGLVNTVAHKSTLLNIYAFIVYVTAIVMIVLCYFKKELRDTSDTALIVTGAILVNVGVTAALIFCQSRYMIYNMALFYMVLLLMFVKMFFGKRKD